MLRTGETRKRFDTDIRKADVIIQIQTTNSQFLVELRILDVEALDDFEYGLEDLQEALQLVVTC